MTAFHKETGKKNNLKGFVDTGICNPYDFSIIFALYKLHISSAHAKHVGIT